jgi:hypothetical protein
MLSVCLTSARRRYFAPGEKRGARLFLKQTFNG